MVQHYLSEIRLSDISSLCRDKILVGWDIVNFMYHRYDYLWLLLNYGCPI